MRFLVNIHTFLNSVQDRLAQAIIRCAYVTTKPGILPSFALIPALVLAFILGAYSVPLGIINALVSSFTAIKRSINQQLKDMGV